MALSAAICLRSLCLSLSMENHSPRRHYEFDYRCFFWAARFMGVSWTWRHGTYGGKRGQLGSLHGTVQQLVSLALQAVRTQSARSLWPSCTRSGGSTFAGPWWGCVARRSSGARACRFFVSSTEGEHDMGSFSSGREMVVEAARYRIGNCTIPLYKS
jgi:hypothetical protein